HRLGPPLEPEDLPRGAFKVGRGGQAVDGVGREDDDLAGPEGADGVFYDSQVPSTTRWRPARSGHWATPANPSDVRRPQASPAPRSATSSTSQPPGWRTDDALRAIASVTPRPTRACLGSQSRTSGSSESISSGST